MELIGYCCAILVGVSLGIFGSGGSILTVPIMVYLMNINPVDATGYSLFVVGLTSAVGGANYVQKKMVHFKTALIFGIPSILSVFLTRMFLIPLIPDIIFSTASYILTKKMFIMFIFSALMVIVAYTMIRKKEYNQALTEVTNEYNYYKLISIGVVSGCVTGFLGVGGGFIIIPALFLYANIPLKISVGTSLLIIAFNSLSGFTELLMEKHDALNFRFLLGFTFFSLVGIGLGYKLLIKLNSAQLKVMFGWFILLMGICVFLKELL